MVYSYHIDNTNGANTVDTATSLMFQFMAGRHCVYDLVAVARARARLVEAWPRKGEIFIFEDASRIYFNHSTETVGNHDGI